MAPVDPDPVKIKTSSSLSALKADFKILRDSSLMSVVRREEMLVVV
jgi:hypothetical protein